MRFYWWVVFPIWPTLYFPAIVVSWATIANVGVTAWSIVKTVFGKHEAGRAEFRVNKGVS